MGGVVMADRYEDRSSDSHLALRGASRPVRPRPAGGHRRVRDLESRRTDIAQLDEPIVDPLSPTAKFECLDHELLFSVDPMSAATLITFDDLAPATQLSDEYASVGVLLS